MGDICKGSLMYVTSFVSLPETEAVFLRVDFLPPLPKSFLLCEVFLLINNGFCVARDEGHIGLLHETFLIDCCGQV